VGLPAVAAQHPHEALGEHRHQGGG
jgi:hypothetical protein